MEENKKLRFYGGEWVSFLPIIVFILITLCFTLQGAPDVKGLWLGAFAGVFVTFFLAKDKSAYCQSILDGFGDKGATIPFACFIFAGLFAAILRESGLVGGIIWAAYKLGATGNVFIIVSFLAACLFATSAGTGFGAIVACMSVLYPAGTMLGANPMLLTGAIIGGGCFGDNLAPVSDTTICSAASMETDVGGVVKSRLRYSLVAAAATIIITFIIGSFAGSGTVEMVPYEQLQTYMFPKGLIMLVPALLTIVLAMKKGDIIYAMIIGSVVGLVFVFLFRMPSMSTLVTIQDGAVGGSLVNGIGDMLPNALLVIMIIVCVQVLREGGGDQQLMQMVGKVVKTVVGAELSVAVLSFFMGVVTVTNSAAIFTVGSSFGKSIGKKFNIHPYRVANIMDCMATGVTYALPYNVTITVPIVMAVQAHDTFGASVPVLNGAMLPVYVIYPMVMIVLYLIAIITGYGRRYLGEDGSPVKKNFQD
ncbi:Na+/H+ antiporter NhaC family protein [Lachnospiraceae bacterium 29-91]|nr:Na+/H+ antiporter NhaC family protein [uncultured Schaedlerella sp.]EOS36168.1 hypothetical protein C808_04385 [Lachnospiraceae bacterium M18-1]MCI9153533.1 sodium:proton antiporter [Ruminococcus sp.]